MTSPLDFIEHGIEETPHAHLWPTVPSPGRDWIERGKCTTMQVTRDNDPFDLGGHVTRRRQRALAACAGCPVMRECAQDALHSRRDNGVVRAGTWLPPYAEGAAAQAVAIARLERIAGVGQVAA